VVIRRLSILILTTTCPLIASPLALHLSWATLSRNAVLYETPTPDDPHQVCFSFQIVKKTAASLLNSHLELTLWCVLALVASVDVSFADRHVVYPQSRRQPRRMRVVGVGRSPSRDFSGVVA